MLPTCHPQGVRGHSAESPQGCLGAPLSWALRLPPDCICLLLPRPGHGRAVCALERGAGTQDSPLLLPLLPDPRRGSTEFFPRKMPEFTRQHSDTRDTGAIMSGQGSSGWTAAELTGGKWR